MKKIKKTLALLCCAVLLVCISVGATIAYLTSTDEVKNTFTVGHVTITLDEVDVYDPDDVIPEDSAAKPGDKKPGEPRTDKNKYQLFPGHQYIKDPTVHVAADSEDCYVFVKVVNEIEAIEDNKTIAAQMAEKGWLPVTGETNVYYYKDVAKARDNIVVFETFKIKGTVTNTVLAAYANKTVTVAAYAVQKDGFADANAAWTAGNNENNWVAKTPVDDTQGE